MPEAAIIIIIIIIITVKEVESCDQVCDLDVTDRNLLAASRIYVRNVSHSSYRSYVDIVLHTPMCINTGVNVFYANIYVGEVLNCLEALRNIQ